MLSPVDYDDATGVWLKRDDLYETPVGVRGAKARGAYALAHGQPGVVTVGSRRSAQMRAVAEVARGLGIPCHVVVAAAKGRTKELVACEEVGAEVHEVRPGYLSVVTKRARELAGALGYAYLPPGLADDRVVNLVRGQVLNLPPQARRVVLAVGSGVTAAGVVRGFSGGAGASLLGITVGGDPRAVLDRFAPFWSLSLRLAPSGTSYEREVEGRLGGVRLHPLYEAKVVPYLRRGDVLWVVG